MTVPALLVLGATAWTAVAASLAVLVGRGIRLADERLAADGADR